MRRHALRVFPLALAGAILVSAVRAPQKMPAARLVGEPAAQVRREFEGICKDFRAGRNSFYGLAQIEDLKRRLAAAPASPEERVALRGRLAQELLRVGEPEESVRLLGEARAIAQDERLSQNVRIHILRDLGLAQLRRGEQKNCIGFHGPAACILPIGEAGIHRDKDPALAAMRAYREYLTERPDDLPARWLFLVAAMTAGQYPDAVPEEWRVDPKSFRSPEDIGRFPDVATAVGLHIMDSSGGAIADDFDGDGLLDVVTTTINPCAPMHFFHNDGKGHFEERTMRAGLDSQWGGLNVIHADYDNDGFLDLLVLRGAWFGSDGRMRLSLLHNNGDGTFTDVTRQAGLAGKAYPTQAGAWADYDNDGFLDLYVGSESDDQGVPYPSRLFHSNGNGTFTEVAEKAGVENFRMAKGVAWGDNDGDGYPDLYVSNIGPNRLYHNNRDGTFTDVAVEAGVVEPIGRSFATWFFDYDNDGRLDLFVADYGSTLEDMAGSYFGRGAAGGRPRLYRNEGNGKFRDVSIEVGWTEPLLPMGSNFGDLDNDGYLDVYLGTGLPSFESLMPNRMFRNVGGKRFVDVTFSGGFGHLQKGHGVSFADLDNDGDQDVFEQMGGAYPGDAYPSVLYENPGNANSWVKLKLTGQRSNRNAIGARLEIVVAGEDGKTRSIFRTVGAVSSFGGSPYRQEVGLGRVRAITKIEVSWPATKSRQVFANVEPNRFYEIREGDKALRPLPLPRFKLGA